LKKALALSGLVFTIPTLISAQQPAPGVQAGDPVRFTIRDEGIGLGSAAKYRCEGTVSGFSSDTVLVAADRDCATAAFAPTNLSELEIKGGDRGSRLSHFSYGALLGIVVGGVIGRVSAGDGCKVSQCDDAGFAIGVITMVGATVGGAIGAGVGLAIPAGRPWVPLPRIVFRVTPVSRYRPVP
jgi:hypothetical protein